MAASGSGEKQQQQQQQLQLEGQEEKGSGKEKEEQKAVEKGDAARGAVGSMSVVSGNTSCRLVAVNMVTTPQGVEFDGQPFGRASLHQGM